MKAVLFDIDGTLIDSVDLHAKAWIEALRHFGVDVSFPIMRNQIGKGGDQLLPLFLPADRLARQKDEIATYRTELFKRDYLPRVRPFPQVRALFERCRDAGLAIALASSGKADEVARYAEIADIADLVDLTTTADEVEHSKPCPDIFEAALAKCGAVNPADVIAVGDTPYDVEAAEGAGLDCIGMLCGGFPEAQLRRAGAVAIFRDPADLLARFDLSPLATSRR